MKITRQTAHSEDQPLLGDLLVTTKIITGEQLKAMLDYQAGLKKYKPLGQILIEKKLLTVKELNHLLDFYRKRLRIGEILVKTGAITKEQLLVALQFKQTTSKRLGEVLLRLEYLDEDAVQNAVAMQKNVLFVDLDRTTLGDNMGGFIPKTYSVKNRVVPVAVSPNGLTIAVEDRTDFSLLAELQSLTKLKVTVVTSSKDMISRAIQRVYVTNQIEGSTGNTQAVPGVVTPGAVMQDSRPYGVTDPLSSNNDKCKTDRTLN